MARTAKTISFLKRDGQKAKRTSCNIIQKLQSEWAEGESQPARGRPGVLSRKGGQPLVLPHGGTSEGPTKRPAAAGPL